MVTGAEFMVKSRERPMLVDVRISPAAVRRGELVAPSGLLLHRDGLALFASRPYDAAGTGAGGTEPRRASTSTRT